MKDSFLKSLEEGMEEARAKGEKESAELYELTIKAFKKGYQSNKKKNE